MATWTPNGRPTKEAKALAFAELLAAETVYSNGVCLEDLEQVTERLSREAAEAKYGKAARKRKRPAATFGRIMREIDEHTKGLPFRLETSRGPIFIIESLERFAGSGDNSKSRT